VKTLSGLLAIPLILFMVIFVIGLCIVAIFMAPYLCAEENKYFWELGSEDKK